MLRTGQDGLNRKLDWQKPQQSRCHLNNRAGCIFTIKIGQKHMDKIVVGE